VFITNQVVSDPGAGAMFVADPKVILIESKDSNNA
jgi:hypothetical protein